MGHLRPTLRMSWRVGLGYTEDDDRFAELLRLIAEFPTLVDEVTLFETPTHHLYIPLEEYAARAALLARRLDQLRAAGIASVGINVLTTIGHLNEAWDFNAPLPFQPMMGHDGSLSRGCACPNTPELRAYVREKYRLTAQTRPDFIWVDDDIRMQNHGVMWPCFCPTCLGLFAERTGRRWIREDLVAALDGPDAVDLRIAWVQHNSDALTRLLSAVRAAVDEVNPQIQMGLMTVGGVWSSYSGPDHARWFAALRATKSRPGGGYYRDDPRTALIGKAFLVGQQRVAVPDSVTDCQYELENFPYQLLNKGAATVLNEHTMALAMGLNGIACNWLHMWGTSTEDTRPLLEASRRYRPVWEQLVAWCDGLPTVGLVQPSVAQFAGRRVLPPGVSWFSHAANLGVESLALLGLPLAVDEPGCGAVLRGGYAACMEDEQLQELLSGALLMDASALEVLEQRGMAALAGVRIAQRRDNGLLERFTDDELNDRFVGERRDARIEFWGDARGQADVLEPLDAGVRVLAVLEDYRHREHGPCLTAYTNELGGRVAVMAYAPWMFLNSAGKRHQLLNLADWLSVGTLPVRIEPTAAVVPVARFSPDRCRGALVLLNWGLDAVEGAIVEIRAPQSRARLLTPEGELALPVETAAGAWRVSLPRLAPWSTACILIG